jgi:hypothetical protein
MTKEEKPAFKLEKSVEEYPSEQPTSMKERIIQSIKAPLQKRWDTHQEEKRIYKEEYEKAKPEFIRKGARLAAKQKYYGSVKSKFKKKGGISGKSRDEMFSSFMGFGSAKSRDTGFDISADLGFGTPSLKKGKKRDGIDALTDF